jgi:hypothetical protein
MIVWVIISVFVVPLLLSEFSELSPWLARHLLIWGAARLGALHQSERYREEWLAGLDDVPGKLTKLVKALSIVGYTVPVMHWRVKKTVYLWPARRATDALLAIAFPSMRARRLDQMMKSYRMGLGPMTGSFTVGEMLDLVSIALQASAVPRFLSDVCIVNKDSWTLVVDHRRKRLHFSRLDISTPDPALPPSSS